MPIAFDDDRSIRDLLARYCSLLDGNRIGELGAVFTDDAEVHFIPGTVIRGLPTLIAHLTDRMVPVQATSHHLANTVLQELPDAHVGATSYLYAWHRYTDGRPDGILHGQYRDIAQQTSEGWRLAYRKLVVHGMEGFDRPVMHMLDRR